MKTHDQPDKYFLLDTNIIVAYYLPQASCSKKASERARMIIDYVKKGGAPNWVLLIPNIAIAEAFNTFAKYCYGKWNPHVKKNIPGGLDQRKYKTIRKKFRDHIHNGKLFHQIELNRYHILYSDLISPLDHYYQIYRKRGNKAPLQTMDILILAMGIELNHLLGAERFYVITADNRMNDLNEKARNKTEKSITEKLNLDSIAAELNFEFSGNLFPRSLNLAKATKQEMKDVFSEWPLEVPKRSKTDVK